MSMLEKELKYFNDHKAHLISEYEDQYVVIVGESVKGVYPTENEAYIAAAEKHPSGTFLIRLCSEKTDSYTQTFHSRVSFI